MLDHLRLAIPVFPVYACERGSGVFYFEGDILALGLNCGARVVRLDDYGKAKPYDLYAPYDTLGTDFSDMAIKFYDKGRNCLPYLELKASPAKLLQGHNVYGSDDIALGAIEMLGLVCEALPNLCAYLDFTKTEVLHIDATYSATLPSQAMVAPVLSYLTNISNGHAKAQNVAYDNYIRWGTGKTGKDGKPTTSRYINRKAYGKYEETQSQINKLKGQTGTQALNKLNALQQALPFSNAKLRFEARICKTYLVKNGYPSNLYALIELQRQTPELLQQLWQIAFNPIFDTLKGESMTLDNDDKVKELLRAKLFTITKKGNISYSKADAVYRFYKTMKSDGYEKMRKDTAKNTFYDNVRALVGCGISKAHLQNLHTQKPKTIPMHRLVDLDFNNQVPSDFVAPVSRFSHLTLVA